MEPVVGIFTTRTEAERAIERLRSAGITDARMNLLTPGASEAELDRVIPALLR